MSEAKRLIGIPLSMGLGKNEWHQRTGVFIKEPGKYQLHPGLPDAGTLVDIEFVARPYQQQNASTGVTAEALIYTVVHHLERPEVDENTREAIKHLDAALELLHERRLHVNKE